MSEMSSFQDAFYIIAKELGFDYAQPLSPREVFEQQMLPRIRELVATHGARDGDERVAFESDPAFVGMNFSRGEGHPEYYDSPFLNGAWEGWQARATAHME